MAASRLSVAARRRRRSALLLAATVAAIAGALALNAAGAVERLEYQAIDTRFSIRGSTGAPKNVVVVGVDAKTFGTRRTAGSASSGRSRAAATPRSSTSSCSDGARVIAYDVQFTEPSPTGERVRRRTAAAVDLRGDARRPPRRAGHDRGRPRRRHRGARRRRDPPVRRRRRRERHHARRSRRDRAAGALRARRAALVRRVECASGAGTPALALAVRRPGAADRLLRTARHDPHVLVLRRRGRALPAGDVQRQGRRRRRGRAEPPGPVRHLDVGQRSDARGRSCRRRRSRRSSTTSRCAAPPGGSRSC